MTDTPKCAWCGRKLKPVTGWEERPATPHELEIERRLRKERDDRIKEIERLSDNGKLDFSDVPKLRQKAERRYDSLMVQQLPGIRIYMGNVTSQQPTGRWGYRSNGLFCTLNCGYEMGKAAVRAGYTRIK